MHYPNLMFPGVEAIRAWIQPPSLYVWLELAASDVLLPDCTRFTGNSEVVQGLSHNRTRVRLPR